MDSSVRWIRPEDFHEQTASLNFFHRLTDTILFDMSFDVDEENVFPGFPARRAGFDFCHIEAV
jgi:hypothetical protein